MRPVFDRQGRKVGVYGIDLNMSWLHHSLDEMEENIWKEFYETPHHDSQTDDDDESEIGFSIQVIDSQGKCIAGTDSIDLTILEGEQKMVMSEFDMMDQKGTPFILLRSRSPIQTGSWSCSSITT